MRDPDQSDRPPEEFSAADLGFLSRDERWHLRALTSRGLTRCGSNWRIAPYERVVPLSRSLFDRENRDAVTDAMRRAELMLIETGR